MGIYYPDCRINLSGVFDGFGGVDEPTVITNILPYSANVHCNSYKEADTWEITFDAKRFPFSPEVFRSVAVEIYAFNKQSQTSPLQWSDTRNLLVTGLVDRASITEDKDGGKITMSGRDYTSLMIDRQWDPTESGKGGRVPDGELDEVIQQLVDEATNSKLTGRTLTVRMFDVETLDNNPVQVSKVDPGVTHKSVTIKKTTHHRTRKKRGILVKADSTYWDVIYKLALSFGYIVFVKGFDVIVTKPHVLQSMAGANYRVAYGTNLSKLEVERKMSKEAVPQIRVRSYDPKSKKVIEGVFPTEKDLTAQKEGKDKKGKGGGFLTGVGTKREEYKVYTIPDVKDEKTLTEIARSTYYTLARGEGIVRCATPHLRDTQNQDLLQMRAGDSIEIKWDAFKAEVMGDKNISATQKINTLMALGYDFTVASLVANQYSKLDYFRTPFYVKEVNYTWDKDKGMQVDIEAMNFINPESPRFQIRS